MSECIEWHGTIRRSDGRAILGRRYAYVVAMELHLGRVVRKNEVCHHTCHNPACINVDHMEVMTQAEHVVLHADTNALTSVNKKTHCKHGHPFVPGSHYIQRRVRPGKKPYTTRVCKICHREQQERHRMKKLIDE